MLQVNRSGKRKMVTWLNMLRKCNLYLADPILEPSQGLRSWHLSLSQPFYHGALKKFILSFSSLLLLPRITVRY